MKFVLTVETGNQALTDEGGPAELARLLERAGNEVQEGQMRGRLRDYNGNVVGAWEYDQ